jgi:hypothetical protein
MTPKVRGKPTKHRTRNRARLTGARCAGSRRKRPNEITRPANLGQRDEPR